MKMPANVLCLLVLGFAAATIAAFNATFGGVKPDLKTQDLIPSGLPALAETQNR